MLTGLNIVTSSSCRCARVDRYNTLPGPTAATSKRSSVRDSNGPAQSIHLAVCPRRIAIHYLLIWRSLFINEWIEIVAPWDYLFVEHSQLWILEEAPNYNELISATIWATHNQCHLRHLALGAHTNVININTLVNTWCCINRLLVGKSLIIASTFY